MLSDRSRVALHVATAPLIVGAAAALHLFLEASFGFVRPYVVLFVAVLVTSWLGGIEAALGVALLSAALGHFVLYRAGPEIPGPYLSLGLFILISVALAGVLNSWRQALRRTDAALAQVRARERELEAARDAAEAGNRTKSRFLATVSHEIRTPMNAVMGMSNLLLESPLSIEQRDFVDTIRSSAEALLGVLNDVLDFSKIESGRLEIEHRPFELRECLESALDMLAPGAAVKGLELLYRLDPSLPESVVGDSTRLRQILINLIGNAIKFTERGEIELAVAARAPAGTGAAADGAIRELHLAVRDTGVGIPAGARERLFQSFSQGDASTTRWHGGTGLGLAISKALAEAMGGTAWAESEGIPGRGSTFHVTIRAEVPPGETVHQPDGDPLLHGKRVLVVDDNETHREILGLELRACGIRCAAAASGAEAIACLDAGESFDAALLDRDMPEMDGVSLARAIRARSGGAHLPLVLLIAATQREDAARPGLFDAVLKKPVRRSKLHPALVTVLSMASSPEDAPPHPPSQFDAGLASRLPLRILLAEDSPTNRRIALLMLRRMGYEADVAENGLETLAALERRRYDLVLMDFEMPKMDGVEATRRIRAQWPRDAQPRIIGLTANASREDHEAFLAAGMDACLVKPVRPAELQAALESCAVPRGVRSESVASSAPARRA